MNNPSEQSNDVDDYPAEEVALLFDYTKFLNRFRDEDDRSAVLGAAALLDFLLARTLAANFADKKIANELLEGANAPLGTFSSRISMCHALGLTSVAAHHDLHLVRRIRNKFAHEWSDLTLNESKLAAWCGSFKLQYQGLDPRDRTPRDSFISTIGMLGVTLIALPIQGKQPSIPTQPN